MGILTAKIKYGLVSGSFEKSPALVRWTPKYDSLLSEVLNERAIYSGFYCGIAVFLAVCSGIFLSMRIEINAHAEEDARGLSSVPLQDTTTDDNIRGRESH